MSDQSKAFINIENVVASATLNQRIDLNAIVRVFPGVEYRPEQFPGLVYRLKKPKTATLIFSSGKMVCTGAKSEGQARKAVFKVVDELKRDGIVIMGKPEISRADLPYGRTEGRDSHFHEWQACLHRSQEGDSSLHSGEEAARES